MKANKKIVILGAGPSGLTLAHALLDAGCTLDDIVVLEKQPSAGGLCRSEMVDGAPLDIGGGHFLDLKRKEVLEFLFRFMPRDEWDLYDRVSKIRIRGLEIDHPLEANLWQLPNEVQVDYLESIAQAGCVRGEAMPESFAAWVKWKLGDVITREYMLPYNRKIWSMDPDLLGTYWLHKLPNVSFRETLLSCLEGKPMGALPAHGTFLYPKEFGYGEVWRRMGEALGDSLVTSCPVEYIDLTARTVNGRWQAQTIISTIPWALWPGFCDLPTEILTSIASLKNAAIDVDYHPETLSSSAHWVYEPDESIAYHRLLLRSNFVPGARGHWTETNAARSLPSDKIRFHNEYAYPINTLGKPEAVQEILAWGRNRGVVGLGRWGRWEHLNSDVAVAEALQMASVLCPVGVE
ncbi:MAG: NAD(P)-binding protein [Desulfuromonadales bacterium]|nr:NAD(P)-binding protein [Desulfuromonadales bacterium]